TVAYGGSAGGMLMGAIANMRPDLWAGIIAAVPFVDVLNTMSDVSLPLTPPEWPEWGDPIHDDKAYDYIASYSPYDNVAAKAYPAILATGGLSDPRVTYWEPAKWT
ncbi:prolyl oligopeptidase family serine peptidase, partial [Pandoraea nosoerga]|nr:prolyl oligopeptidase family serine peptidase [Pandoraea nosoerga]